MYYVVNIYNNYEVIYEFIVLYVLCWIVLMWLFPFDY